MRNSSIKKKITEMVQDRIKASGTEENIVTSMPNEDRADGIGAERTSLSDGMANYVAGGGRAGDPQPPHCLPDLGTGGTRQ